MTKQEAKQNYFIEKRVRALATIYLARRANLEIIELKQDQSIDLMIDIHGEDRTGFRLFGVELKGAWSVLPANDANREIGKQVRESRKHGPFTFPVCLFYFTMEDTQAWYAWVAEPVNDPGNGPSLLARRDVACQPLTDDEIDAIVSQVNQWYDARRPLQLT